MFDGSAEFDGRKLVLSALRISRLIPDRSWALIGELDHCGVKLMTADAALMSIQTTLACCDAT
jgi:hypothetical protein